MSGDDPPRADPRLVRTLYREAMTRAGEGRLTLVARTETGEDRRRLGRSMLPSLAPGEEIAWRAPAREPRVGDIVVFEDRDRAGEEGGGVPSFVAVVHRVIGVRPDGTLVTKGDNRATSDPEALPAGSVLGIVTRTCGPGPCASFEARGAQVYGRAAAWVSAAGDSAFRVARGVDALLGRSRADEEHDWPRQVCARRAAWLAQRLAQRALHRLAFRACHRIITEDGEET